MKILHVITSLDTGGAEKLMVDLLPRMCNQGHVVELCVFDGTRTSFMDDIEAKGIKIHKFNNGGNIYNPVHVFRLWKLLRQGWDIVHTHNTASQLFAAMCSVVCSVVLCTTEHTTSNRRRDWTWYRPIDKWMYSKYTKILCISDQTEALLIQATPSVRGKTVVACNGIDTVTYSQAEPLLEERPDNKILMTMVAGFRYQKDQDTVVRAMNLLPPQYELWLIGDGERRHVLETLVAELNLADRVIFKGVRTDVDRILKSSDFAILSSHYEGFGLAAVEAMAAGLPVIASDVPGLREVVRGAGVLFNCGNENELADIILKLTNDSDYYKQICESCIRRAKQYDISIMVDKYMNVYKQICC